jgi:hypothetical protein
VVGVVVVFGVGGVIAAIADCVVGVVAAVAVVGDVVVRGVGVVGWLRLT